MPSLTTLNRRIVACERCPRLRKHCLDTARTKRAAYRTETYFGLPVPNFGEADARQVGLLIVGLAPAAHGANRTGRMFTGDRSGDFLFRALHETGFANQPTSRSADDGLALSRALITAACHCAPPGNKPTPEELALCAPHLDDTFDALPRLAAVLCLGRLALDATLRLLLRKSWIERPGAYAFGHGVEHRIERPRPRAPLALLCSYHPSQQNTFTGRLTPAMLRDVLTRARALVDASPA
ncbi:MAG: uracil-DNA glycosylase [Planctomycetota bacterium]|nr:uracil-DNA glycosylase [Planctomycetota bacterium]